MLTAPFPVPLPNGASVLLRPLVAADAPRLQRGLAFLSPASRADRFFVPVERFTPAELRYLCDVDQRTHVAWVALDPLRPNIPGVGVARFVRLPQTSPVVAEAAVTVIDGWQRRGLGSVLFALLYCRARHEGLATLRAVIRPDRRWLADGLRGVGGPARLTEGTLEIDVPVVDDETLRERPGAAWLHAALRRLDDGVAAAAA